MKTFGMSVDGCRNCQVIRKAEMKTTVVSTALALLVVLGMWTASVAAQKRGRESVKYGTRGVDGLLWENVGAKVFEKVREAEKMDEWR